MTGCDNLKYTHYELWGKPHCVIASREAKQSIDKNTPASHKNTLYLHKNTVPEHFCKHEETVNPWSLCLRHKGDIFARWCEVVPRAFYPDRFNLSTQTARGAARTKRRKDGKTRSIAFLPSFILTGKESN
jgi:hypothetical protein